MNFSLKVAGVLLLVLMATSLMAGAQGLENLTLESCVKIALSTNPEVAAARAQVEEKKGEEAEAASQTYPSLLGSGSFIQLTPTLDAVFGPFSFPIDAAESFNTGLSVQYSIYNGGRVGNAATEARLSAISQEFSMQKTNLDKVLGVKEAFYQVLLGLEQIRASRWFLNGAEFNESTAEQLYETGGTPRLVYLNARIRRQKAEEDLSNARAAYQEDLDTLAMAMGLRPGEVQSVSGNFPQTIIPSYSDLLREAYENRPELKEDATEIKKDKVGIEVAQATDAPDVSVFAGGFYFTRPFIPFTSAFQEQAGVQVRWPFEFGQQGARLQEARARLAEARARLKQDRHSLSVQLSTAFTDAEEAQKEIIAYSQSVQESRTSFEDALAAFANNLITGTQFDETQDLSNQAQLDYLQSLYRYSEALARISYLTGETK